MSGNSISDGMIVAALVTAALMFAACTARIKPSDPDYGHWFACAGGDSRFSVGSFEDRPPFSDRMRSCMERHKAWQQEELEKKQRQETTARERRAREDAEDARQQTEAEEQRNRVREEQRNLVRVECGNDYGKIRVGMRLDRLKKCWGRFHLFRLTGEVDRADGVVSIYEMRFMSDSLVYAVGVSAIYVMHHKVVGWTR